MFGHGRLRRPIVGQSELASLEREDMLHELHLARGHEADIWIPKNPARLGRMTTQIDSLQLPEVHLGLAPWLWFAHIRQATKYATEIFIVGSATPNIDLPVVGPHWRKLG